MGNTFNNNIILSSKDYYVVSKQYNNQILNDWYKFIYKTLKKHKGY